MMSRLASVRNALVLSVLLLQACGIDAYLNERALARVARTSNDRSERRSAVLKLHDQEVLAEVVLADDDAWVREAAAGRPGQVRPRCSSRAHHKPIRSP